MIETNKKTNSLIHEKSPYLLQHAYNPVNWYPWKEEALNRAKEENKPIFVSIGYSTCHWCHVMEKESFEDNDVSELLNKYFISIKVDREERPDIDHLYMEFCQALTGSGGWPLTIIMTPDKKPFFTGTYFPKNRRYGRQGLMELLEQIGLIWESNQKKLLEAADEIVDSIYSQKISNQKGTSSVLNPISDEAKSLNAWGEEIIKEGFSYLEKVFDPKYGGFAQAPKFPTPHILSFLLRYGKDNPKSSAFEMVRKTLDGMALGGIYDHIGFGFSRYSTDQKWLVPHFEKMLYDNALLAYAYLESFQVLHEEHDARMVNQIFSYVLRDMTSSEGGFYSAEDADSEGVEGKFYVWTPEEVKQVLGEKSAQLYCEVYDITEDGNFEGKSIPNLLHRNWEKLAQERHLTLEELQDSLDSARQSLFAYREKRIHPHKDDKILTSWNGIMIAALAKGAQVLNNKTYLQAAEKAADFIMTKLRTEDGRLLARYREGEAAYLGYLDDYAYLIWGLLELYFASGKTLYLKWALELQEDQERLFFDPENNGYFLTGSDAEELLYRPKEFYDGAQPSGNSVSALNLLRLARITGNERWDDLAQKQLKACYPTASEHPAGYTVFLQSLQFALHSSQELVLAGSLNTPELPKMQKVIFKDFYPYATFVYQEGTLSDLVPWVKDYPVPEKDTTAYLCENFTCQQPVNTSEELANLLHQIIK